ncbi:MAG: hypothetical protein AAGA30_18515 [Planctomycetota bacterium]
MSQLQRTIRRSTLPNVILVSLSIAFSSQLLKADTLLYSNSWTGAELASDANVVFPTRAPVVNGTSVDFATGNQVLEKLFVIPLIGAGTLNSNAVAVMDVNVNLTRLTQDSDVELAIGDGNQLASFQPGDNNNGQAQAVGLNDLGTTVATQEFFQLFDNAGFPPIGQSLDVVTSITLRGNDSVNIGGNFNSSFGDGDLATVTLDTSQALSFVFVGNDINEQYRVNSLTVELRGQSIPEPTATLAILGLSGLLFKRRRGHASY